MVNLCWEIKGRVSFAWTDKVNNNDDDDDDNNNNDNNNDCCYSDSYCVGTVIHTKLWTFLG